MREPTVVLLSGGLDSACVLAQVLHKNDVNRDEVVALSITYGQKHTKEAESAQWLADYYGVRLVHKDLSEVFSLSNCSLLKQSDQAVPKGPYIEQQETSETGVVNTYVPYRNGLFISAASSIAMSLFPERRVRVYFGAHADDAAGNAYPDCSEAFFKAIAEAVLVGTDGSVFVKAPFIRKTKAEIVAVGLKEGVPFEHTWSCYGGGEKPCGKCGTCIDRMQAFNLNGVIDPSEYEEV